MQLKSSEAAVEAEGAASDVVDRWTLTGGRSERDGGAASDGRPPVVCPDIERPYIYQVAERHTAAGNKYVFLYVVLCRRPPSLAKDSLSVAADSATTMRCVRTLATEIGLRSKRPYYDVLLQYGYRLCNCIRRFS